ncbi:tyrosine-type recombinase/integrase [Brucella tritici]|uniref:tyrosine-type recombinase/integrase n=1 Tax=Brucella tritici TaxID=94626 RepID=UPI003D6C9419
MPVIKINQKTVKAIMTPEKTTFYFDETLAGFGMKVAPTGTKSWIVEYRPGAGGRSVTKKRMRIGGMELSPDQARTAAEKVLASVSLGGNPAADRAGERAALSVAEIADRFMRDHVRKKRKENSVEGYEGAIEKHIKPAIGKKAAEKVTRADLTKLHNKVSEKQADGTGGPYAANKMLSVLSKMYNWAGDLGLIKEGTNPAQKIERFDETPRERFLTGEELERLGAALIEAETSGIPYEVEADGENSRHRKQGHQRHVVYDAHITGAIRLLLLTGCRLREILHLRWSEVDFERGLLFLPDSKTGRKTVVLSDAAIEVLKLIPQIGVYVVASESAGLPEEKPRHDIKKPWAMITARAGLKGLRIHDLRHTYASIGAGGGLGLPVIGKLLGHSQASTTQRYAHLDVDPVRRAANIIAGNISGKLGGK